MTRRLAILTLSLLFLKASAQEIKNIIREGSVLTYKVKSASGTYDFTIVIKKLGEAGEVKFDWQMSAPINKSGSITISKEAYENSYALYNQFTGGHITLDKQTSVFISFMLNLDISASDTGTELEENIKTAGLDEQGESFTVVSKAYDFTYKEDGRKKTIKTAVIQNKGGDKTVQIYNESTDAFIVRMNIGFNIELLEIKY